MNVSDTVVAYIEGKESALNDYLKQSRQELENSLVYEATKQVTALNQQRENIRDENAYKLHVEKELSPLNRCISGMLELGVSYSEIEFYCESYLQCNLAVNKAEHIAAFNALRKYEAFDKFCKNNEKRLTYMTGRPLKADD